MKLRKKLTSLTFYEVKQFFRYDLHLKLFHLNIRSIRKIFDELCILLSGLDVGFDIIILTETWLTHDFTVFDIAGYTKVIKPTKFNKCDGIIVYIKNELNYTILETDIDYANVLNFRLMYDDLKFY